MLKYCILFRSWVQLLVGAQLCNNCGQVAHILVLLPPSSRIACQSVGSDVERLGR